MNAVSWFDGLATPDKWRGNLQARAPRIAVWVLALAIGVQAAIIVTNFAGTSTAPSIAMAQAPVSVPEGPRRANVAGIANSHIFGTAAPPAQPQQDAANAPQTSMPLVLTGIIADDDPRTGFAILGESAAAAKVYAVGDNVPGGARLHSVYEDRVLLDRGGRLESLALPRNAMAGMTEAPPPPTAPPTTESLPDRMKRLIAEEPGVISDVMRPQPVFAQGKQRGYRVYPGRNRQAFMRLGLKPGDLVVSINGTPLDDPARGQEIFRTIGSSSEAHVTVMRNGRQQDLTLNMSQVAADAESLVGGGEGSMAPTEQQPQMPPQPETGGND
jgi:general secretion pathway protein C